MQVGSLRVIETSISSEKELSKNRGIIKSVRALTKYLQTWKDSNRKLKENQLLIWVRK